MVMEKYEILIDWKFYWSENIHKDNQVKKTKVISEKKLKD